MVSINAVATNRNNNINKPDSTEPPFQSGIRAASKRIGRCKTHPVSLIAGLSITIPHLKA
jgi:hypothetical protein